MSVAQKVIAAVASVAVVVLISPRMTGQSTQAQIGDQSIQANLQTYMAARTAAYRDLTTFSIGVYSDIHMVEDPTWGLTRAQWQNLLVRWRDSSYLFGMIVGDLGYGRVGDPSNVLSGPAAVPSAPPVFYAMGNHETDGIGKRAWVDAIYPGAVAPASWSVQPGLAAGNADHVYYSFDVGRLTHCIVLDGDYLTYAISQTYLHQTFGQAQLTWLAADIKANPDKNLLVFVHEPIDQQLLGASPNYTSNDKGGLIDLLSVHPKKTFVFSGHMHGLGGTTHWKGITSVHVMTGSNPNYGVGVTVNGDQITLTNAGAVTEFDQHPMNQVDMTSGRPVIHVAEDGVSSGNTSGPKMAPVSAENGVTPTSGNLMLKAQSMTWYDPRFISEQLIKIQPGMRFSFDIYLLGVVNSSDAVTVQPNWYMKDGSLPPQVVDQNGIPLSRRTVDGTYFVYNQDLPKLGDRATGRWYHRDFDLSALAGNYVDGIYLTGAATIVNVGTIYVDNIRFTTGTSTNTPPQITLTSPAEGTSFVAPATIPLRVTASDSDGTVTQVSYYANSTLIGTVAAAPFTATWAPVPLGNYTVTAIATDNSGATTTSAPVHFTVSGSGGGGGGSSPSAAFLGADSTTQGNWKNVYGVEGYLLAGDATSPPSYGAATPGGLPWTWASTSSDVRALQRASATGRVAAGWYGASFVIDVNLTDTRTHKVSLYVVDWDSRGRGETLQVINTATGAVLDTRTVSGFDGGRYLTWSVSGHVSISVTLTAGVNAVVSGLFFDPSGVSANAAPLVTMTGPVEGASFLAPATIPLSVAASDSDGTVTQVSYYSGSTLIGTVSSSPFSAPWTSVPAGSYTLTAKATDNLGATTTSAPVHITVGSAGGGGGAVSAAFLRTDATTQGNWKGIYGLDGYVIASDATSLPTFAAVTPGGSLWTWASSSSDTRALQRASGGTRLAATWTAGIVTADVNLTDTLAHRLTLYVLDWDARGREETIQLINASTGAVLDTRAVTGFAGGQYWTWSVTGHVLVRVTSTIGPNAVYSGMFLDR